jgi:hypothetical protein
LAALERCRGHEVCAWRRDQASGFHGGRVIRATRSWRGWRRFIFMSVPVWDCGARFPRCAAVTLRD